MKQEISIIKATLDAMQAFSPQQKKEALDILAGKLKHPTDQIEKSILLTRAEAAKLLGCSPMTIYRLVKDGKLQPVKLREKNRYRRVDLEKIAGLH
jgi:excisionase family DNA binding protein